MSAVQRHVDDHDPHPRVDRAAHERGEGRELPGLVRSSASVVATDVVRHTVPAVVAGHPDDPPASRAAARRPGRVPVGDVCSWPDPALGMPGVRSPRRGQACHARPRPSGSVSPGSGVELRRPRASRGSLAKNRLIELIIRQESLQPSGLPLEIVQPDWADLVRVHFRPQRLSSVAGRTARDRHPQPLTAFHATVRTAHEKSGFKAGLRQRENPGLSVARKLLGTST